VSDWTEKPVTMDGHELETGDVMTLRVALNHFMMWLDDPETEKSLGEIHEGYWVRTRRMLATLSAPKDHQKQ